MKPDKKLHVVFLSSWFPTKDQPTLGNFVKRHAMSVAKHATVSVIHCAPASTANVTFQAEGNYRECVFYYKRSPLDYFLLHQRYEKALSAFQNEFDWATPDLIHLNVVYPAGRIALAWQKKWGVPMIVSEHWTGYHTDTHSSIRPWQLNTMKAVAKNAAYMCPVTMDLAESMQQCGLKGNYSAVPNVVDTTLFHPDKKNPNSEKKFQFLHVSSLFDQHKNITGMLEAFSRTVRKHASAHLTVLGDGDPKPHRITAERLSIPQANIRFAGEQSLEDIAQLMRTSDCFVLFSRYENLPCVIGESWASGVPVIATDVGGIREHLTPERGNMVESEDIQGLADAMSERLTHPSRIDPESLRSYSVEHFSYEAIGAQFMELYQSALNPVKE